MRRPVLRAEHLRSLVLVAAVSALAGCTPVHEPELAVAPRDRTCDVSAAAVTTFGPARARLFAEGSLRLQLADLKGEMVHSGLRRVRVTESAVRCEPSAAYGGLGDLHQCVAKARICGI